MFDWLGSLHIFENARNRLVLGLGRSTQTVGLAMFVLGGLLVVRAASTSWWLASMPGAVALFGLVVATMRRRLEFDRTDGVLRIHQSALGIGSTTIVPLFHLRAVVVALRPTTLGSRTIRGNGYVAYIDRRVGEAIYLDEARRSKGLFRMAEAIADLTELRIEYEAASAIDETG